MPTPIEEYIEARNVMIQASAAVQRMAETIRNVSHALSTNSRRFLFANLPSGMPAEVAMSRDVVTVDANSWPSAQALQDALRDMHEARTVVFNAWSRVPQEQRSALQPPPPER